MTLILEEFRDVDEIPADFDILFETAGGHSVFLSRDWFALLASDAIPAQAKVHIFAARDADGTPLALLPCLKNHRSLTSLSNYYSHEFAPVLNPDAANTALVQALGGIAASISALSMNSVVLKPFLPDDPALELTEQAFQMSGFKTARFHAGTRRYINSTGVSGSAYQSQLPSRLLNTITRRQKADTRQHRFELFALPSDLPQAVEFYQHIYARSWKDPEPMPGFIPGLAALLADRGALRLGVWFVDEIAAATQLWIVENRRASVFKLAHDSAFENLSVGTALTLQMFRSILDKDQPEYIDFGIGNEPFKADWTPDALTLIGLAAFNGQTIVGRLQHLRHVAGQLIKRTGRTNKCVQYDNDGKPKVRPR